MVGIYWNNTYMTQHSEQFLVIIKMLVFAVTIISPSFQIYFVLKHLWSVSLSCSQCLCNSSTVRLFIFFYSVRGNWSRDSQLILFLPTPTSDIDTWSLVRSCKASLNNSSQPESHKSYWSTLNKISIFSSHFWNPSLARSFPLAILLSSALRILFFSFLWHNGKSESIKKAVPDSK